MAIISSLNFSLKVINSNANIAYPLPQDVPVPIAWRHQNAIVGVVKSWRRSAHYLAHISCISR